MAWSYYKAGQYDKAIAQANTTLASNTEYTWAETILSGALTENGKPEEALIHLANVEKKQRTPTSLTYVEEAYALAILGRKEEARRKIEQIRAAARKIGYLDPYFLAIAYAGLREDVLAIDELFRAEEVGSLWMFSVQVEPKFKHLRQNPRFLELLHKMRLK